MTETANMTVIGQGTHIKGEMSFDRTARILGIFEGKVSSAGEVQIGESATCRADVQAATVLVDGKVEGNIVASEKVQLNAGAEVVGDITAATLIVAAGASMIGMCRVGPAASGVKAETKTEAKAESKNKASRSTDDGWDIQTRTGQLDAVLGGYGERVA
jgi:cytoskeletal protein CcmA (bactofilin family)